MPDPKNFTNQKDFMSACVPMRMNEGDSNEQAVGACMGMWNDHMMKSARMMFGMSVKVAGDWILDINALPFAKDSDGQWADPATETFAEKFNTPLIMQSHGITPDGRRLEDKPILLGDPVPGSLRKETDGWHINVILNKAVKQARDIWEAAKRNAVAVSSGSISHVARLDIAGKMHMYSKLTPGRIAVWAIAEISLWVKERGSLQPANKHAYALPAMKAIYREAGFRFPNLDTTGASNYADVSAAKRAEIEAEREKAKKLLKYFSQEQK